MSEIEKRRKDVENRLDYILSIDGNAEMIRNLEAELHEIEEQMRKGARV